MGTATETLSIEMTETDWQVAHAIAQTLVKQETDVNELGKAIAYLRNAVNQKQADAGGGFFRYLKTLVNNGRAIGHSGRTLDYYRNIEQVYNEYLYIYQANPEKMLHQLGWVARLMRYYKTKPITEIEDLGTRPVAISTRQAEVAKINQSQVFMLDQAIEAKVLKINSNRVTYEIMGSIRLTQKEPKKADLLHEGQVVKVKITGLKEDKSIKNIKYIDES
jgi:hypothetical protein